MYSREIQEDRRAPVENGNPLQGTWTKAFGEVDLSGIHRPYPHPFPQAVLDSRIKEWESFTLQDDRFFFHARVCNLKYYRAASVFLYDKETRQRQEFNKVIPGSGWRLPRSLGNASLDSRSLGFFFRIHTWLDAERITLAFNIEHKRRKPVFTAHAIFDLSQGPAVPMAVSLLFSERRSMYALKVMTAASGSIEAGGQLIQFDPAKTSGLFCDFKGYYPYRMRNTWCSGMGFDNQNRRFGFALAENQAKESYRNNENALWVDGRLTPLPPVKITRNGGYESEWIIQDMEGMVDLVFTPKELQHSTSNLVFSRFDYENPLGVFNGTLVTAEGEKLPVENVWGMSEKLYLRV